jgi:hypothetical protein
MYQQITKRYVPLRCDCAVSGFYQTDQIQAYPSRSLIASRCLFSIEKRGAARGASSTRGCPTKGKAAYPIASFWGTRAALIMPFESQRAARSSRAIFAPKNEPSLD